MAKGLSGTSPIMSKTAGHGHLRHTHLRDNMDVISSVIRDQYSERMVRKSYPLHNPLNPPSGMTAMTLSCSTTSPILQSFAHTLSNTISSPRNEGYLPPSRLGALWNDQRVLKPFSTKYNKQTLNSCSGRTRVETITYPRAARRLAGY